MTTYISSSDRNQTAFNKGKWDEGNQRNWWCCKAVRTLGKRLKFLDKRFMRGVKRKLRKYKRIRIKVVVGCGGGKDEMEVNKSIAWCKWCKCFN